MTNTFGAPFPSMYHEKYLYAGLTGRRRNQLMMLHRAFSGPFDAAQAANELGLDLVRTRRLLADLSQGGWLSRVRNGWYIGVPLEASEPKEWREDPWVVAAALFSPGYIGGWSAVENWGLTDQIFDVIYVITGKEGQASPPDDTRDRLPDPNRAQTGLVRDAPGLAPTNTGECVRPSSHHH